MNEEDKKLLQEAIMEKMAMVLSAITRTSKVDSDKTAAEAAHELADTLMDIQLMKTERDE